MSPKEYSTRSIAMAAGVEWVTAEKWLLEGDFKPVRTVRGSRGRIDKFWDAKARKYVKDRKSKQNHVHGDSQEKIDPETGLSWFQANLREQTIERRRENEIAEKLKNEEWMSTEAHLKILSAVIGRIEQVPGKAKSEFGLTDSQTIGLRRMLDEAREAAAKQVEDGE